MAERYLKDVEKLWYNPGDKVLLREKDKINEYEVVDCYEHFVVLTTGKFRFTVLKTDLVFKECVLVYER